MSVVVPDMVMPQISLKTMTVPAGEDGASKDVIMMVIETAVTHYEFLLCDADNYVETTNQLSAGLMTAGKTLKKSSKLVAVRGGLPDGLKNGHPRPPQRG